MAKKRHLIFRDLQSQKRTSSLPRFKAQKNRSHTALFLASCVASGYVLVVLFGLMP